MLALSPSPRNGAPLSAEELCAWAARRRRRILVVDDSQTNRMVIGGLLEKVGFEVSYASGGAEAVSLIASADALPEAVLMDVAMPVVDGLAATARIRALPDPHGGVVIIGVSANGLPEDRKECLRVGMNDFVTKPAGKLQLLAVLNRCLDLPALTAASD